MFDALVGHGYRPAEILAMTLRRMNAALELAESRRRRHAAEKLSFAALAARGDGKDIQKQIERLTE
ncbi:MAG: hypothetical protein KGL35_00355 [Bradyrhizobium sp.]|nr:hypothetical protein [Bradyrhizobium sp.]